MKTLKLQEIEQMSVLTHMTVLPRLSSICPTDHCINHLGSIVFYKLLAHCRSVGESLATTASNICETFY